MLQDQRPCPGGTTGTGKPLGICVACTRPNLTGQGERLQPAAYRRPDGAWDCPNRRSDGYVEAEPDVVGD